MRVPTETPAVPPLALNLKMKREASGPSSETGWKPILHGFPEGRSAISVSLPTSTRSPSDADVSQLHRRADSRGSGAGAFCRIFAGEVPIGRSYRPGLIMSDSLIRFVICAWMRRPRADQFWSATDSNESLQPGLRPGLRTGNGLQRQNGSWLTPA
jgi:hypothetical protein